MLSSVHMISPVCMCGVCNSPHTHEWPILFIPTLLTELKPIKIIKITPTQLWMVMNYIYYNDYNIISSEYIVQHLLRAGWTSKQTSSLQDGLSLDSVPPQDRQNLAPLEWINCYTFSLSQS